MLDLGKYKSEVHFLSSHPSDLLELQCEGLFSGTSAFTRIAAATPKQTAKAAEAEVEDDEQSGLGALLAGLDGTVAELISNLKLLQQSKDARLNELRSTV